MRKVMACILIITGCVFMAACATYTSQQPGGARQTYRGPSSHVTDMAGNKIAKEGNWAYNQALAGCAELSTQEQKTPGKVFQYKVNSDGGCEVLIIKDGGEEEFKGIYENRANFDIIVSIKLTRTTAKRVYIAKNSWAYFSLLPGEYEYFVLRASDNKTLARAILTVDAFSKNAYSQLAKQQVAFVGYFKYPTQAAK